ncbi:microspherule protein 1-like [Clavelina lepadiformis]|uniref:microspherule protein 1-like n=1 Tax=Clavelina lepadiformis TaxID=159417 RepID=UPI0040420B74
MSVHQSEAASIGGHRRHSSRSIKRRKFDDELVESSLPSKTQRKSTDGTDEVLSGSSDILSVTCERPSVSIMKLDLSEKRLTRTGVENVKKVPSIPGTSSNERKLAKRKKIKKTRQAFAAVKDMGRWKPTDDILLIDAVEQVQDLNLVHMAVKFSCHFTLEEVQERWYALLYDPVICALAKQAMKSLPYEIAEETHARALFSKEEEGLLSKVLMASKPTRDIFQELLENNTSVFYRLRSAASLEKHWYLMKENNLIADQSVQPLSQGDQIMSFSDAEDMLDDKELLSHKDDLVDHEMQITDRKQKHEIKKLEEEVPRWEVLVSSVTGAPLPELDQHTIAVLRGRLVRYLMRSREITFGRCTEYSAVDIDLSLEGPAHKVSRKQGTIKMKKNGEFILTNEGKRPIYVDGKPIMKGSKARLNHEAVIEIALLRFVFLFNKQLVNTGLG